MLLLLISIFILLVFGLLYFWQEKIIFLPDKLAKNYTFKFKQSFEELTIQTEDGIKLHGLLFKADSSKGLIFYLHGNAGAVDSWGEMASVYTTLNYDLFILDYRGFGKSEGTINSQEQLYKDVQAAYDILKTRYSEKDIIVLGYSIGTGPATKIASTNSPKLLLLQAPYYSLIDVMKNKIPYVPTFLLKYKLETNKLIKECKMPIVIFHGNKDEIFPYSNAIRLKENFKKSDTLFILEGQEHNGITYNPEYLVELRKIFRCT